MVKKINIIILRKYYGKEDLHYNFQIALIEMVASIFFLSIRILNTKLR